MTRSRLPPPCCLALLACCLAGTAQAQAIDTNRPGFSFSPNVVPVGRWQFETGIAYDRESSDLSAWALPLLEIRTGVAENWEVFVSSISWAEADLPGANVNGVLDITLGTKLRLGAAGSRTPMALVLQVSAPTGDSTFSSDRWDPSIAFVWAHDAALPVAGTIKISDFREGYQLDNGLKLPFTLGEGHSAFLEWEANLPEHGGNTHYLNGGYQWLRGQRMQLDINAGVGLNDRAGDYRLGAGLSVVF